MKIGVLLFYILYFVLSVQGQYHSAVERFVRVPALKHAAIGISVKNVTDGRTIAEYNSQIALHPASVTKLISTALAMKQKGAGYRYSTVVSYTGQIKNGVLDGDIMILPSGDPCLDSRYFPDYKLVERLVSEIIKSGIKKINGRILIREKGNTDIPGSWPWEDISNYYGAVCHDFNYRDNTYTIEFRSGKAGSQAEIVRVIPMQKGIRFVSQVKASTKNKDDAWIFGGPYSQEIYVKGTIPQNHTFYNVKGAIHEPAFCFVNEVMAILAGKGVVVSGQSLAGQKPETALFTLTSPSIEEIVFHTNKSSINLFAEALGNLVPDVDMQLKSIGLDTDGIILKDACGLSHLNAVPAAVFTDLLIWADKNLGGAFVCSLPVAGKDGGLQSYCGSSLILKDNLKAKTGSFAGVRCLSGYLKNKQGKQLAFTVLVNNYSCTSSELYDAVRAFLENLIY